MRTRFIVPTIVEEVTDACLANFDADWADLLIIDNSHQSFARKYADRGAEIYYHPYNLGVPGSWNYWKRTTGDFYWIVSTTMLFNQGFSELLRVQPRANQWGLLTDHSFHCIGFTRKCLETIGEFDEQFYPAYYEDNDYLYRLKLAGIHNSSEGNMPKVELHATTQGDALSIEYKKVVPQFYRNQEYYQRKWGGLPGHEIYTTAFNQTI